MKRLDDWGEVIAMLAVPVVALILLFVFLLTGGAG